MTRMTLCCTRSTPCYKLLLEYILLLKQRLTSYQMVLVWTVLWCLELRKRQKGALLGVWRS
jgi:hypothetical protein